MKKIYSFIICALAGFSASAQLPTIAEVRANALGTTVTATGVVSTGTTLGTHIIYFEDVTAGIVGYGNNSTFTGVRVGDSVTVTGALTEFQNLLEIGSNTNPPVLVNHGAARIAVTPLVVPITAINEALEGRLIRLDNVSFTATGNFVENTNYVLRSNTNPSQTIQFRANNIVNTRAIPQGPLTVIAVVSQYGADYQLIVRYSTDLQTYVAPEREIDVVFNGIQSLTGTTRYLGGELTFPVVISNSGTQSLTVSNIQFTGANASEFIVDRTNFTVAGTSSQTVQVTYAPTVNGSHFATMIISNDDADEANYSINIIAGGSDGFMSEPTQSVTNLNFTNVKAYTIAGSFNAVADATSYIVLWNEGTEPISATLQDGVSYLRGDVVGNAKVAYVGTSNGFAPRGIRANKTYNFAVYPFNGQGGSENYLTTSPATGTISSTGSAAGNYYQNISTEASSFVSDLTNLISDRDVITYFNYRQTFMNEFDLVDAPGNKSMVECRYSGYTSEFEGSFDWTAQDFSREHVFAHSWMPGYPYNGTNTEAIPYNDQHNLFPTKYLNVNNTRSNFPFGEVVTAGQSFMGAKRGVNANGDTVFEPKDDVKGDVARALFYQAVAYNNYDGSGTWGIPDFISFIIPYGQDVNLLMDWHNNDLPDSYEIARHEYVASIQNNRNPFIDNPEWACLVNFRTLEKQACNLNAAEIALQNIIVFPNPSKEIVTVFAPDNSVVGYEVIDVQGRSILNESTTETMISFDVTGFTVGTYLVKVFTNNGTAVKKLIVE